MSNDLVLNSCYRRVRSLGAGGTGDVYVAMQLNLERAVVVKEVRDLSRIFPHLSTRDVLSELQAEICKAARLSHPNIVPVLEAAVSQAPICIVSEFVEGQSLRQILSADGGPPPDQAIQIFLQLMHGLRHAHHLGVFHRGLKPENVIIDSAGNARITDFGIAFLHTQAAAPPLHIDTGSIAYLAPEVLQDPRKVDAKADLYAAGIVLYELLSGRIPGRRCRPPSSLHPELPPGIDTIFDRLTLDDPTGRYQSADEVLEDCDYSDVKTVSARGARAGFFLSSRPEPPAEEKQAASN
jgi:serine/threonine protein kinase